MDREKELAARISTVEAVLKAGGAGTASSVPNTSYGFLDKLEGEDRITAQTLIEENNSLRELTENLRDQIDQLNYRITHMKRTIDRLTEK